MCFAELTGVRPMIETYPLEKAAEAYARMMSGNALMLADSASYRFTCRITTALVARACKGERIANNFS
jgi:hypothetical protein